MGRVESLDVVRDAVHAEMATQSGRFEAVDAKSGIVLGFAGALVAMSANLTSPLATTARIAAVGSGACAIAAFWPRRYPELDLRDLRSRFLGSEPVFAKLALLDTDVVMAEQIKRYIESKARRLKFSMLLLLASTVLFCAGVALR